MLDSGHQIPSSGLLNLAALVCNVGGAGQVAPRRALPRYLLTAVHAAPALLAAANGVHFAEHAAEAAAAAGPGPLSGDGRGAGVEGPSASKRGMLTRSNTSFAASRAGASRWGATYWTQLQVWRCPGCSILSTRMLSFACAAAGIALLSLLPAISQ